MSRSVSYTPASRGRSPPAPKLNLQTLSRHGSGTSLNHHGAVISPRLEAKLLASKTGGEISRQVAEWDALMDGLDKQQEQLLNDQWRLLRTQIGSLMGAVAEMRNIADRVTFLEGFIGESADKNKENQGEQDTIAGKQNELKATMEARLEYIEGLIGDSADKHMLEISSALDKMHDLHAAVALCVKTDHYNSLETRMDFLEKEFGEAADRHYKHVTSIMEECMEKRMAFVEKELGESAAQHDRHKTSMEERMEFLESKIGDSAEKHWTDIEAAKAKIGDLHKAVSLCSKRDHHNSLEKRVEIAEKQLGETAEEGNQHKTFIEERLAFLENKIGDSAKKHWNDLQSTKTKLGQSISECAKQEHHSSLEKRIEFVEKELGESADKHDRHKTSMEDRMEFLERKLGDSAEKHWKEIQAAKTKLGDVHKAVGQCARQEHHSSLEKRMAFVEKELGESADKHDRHKTSVEERMEFLESKIGDSAEKHWADIEAAKVKIGDIHKAVSQCAKMDHTSSQEKRLAYLENLVGDNCDKHAKALQDHEKGLLEHKESMDTRLQYLEALLGTSADKHWKEIEAAKKKLGSIDVAVSKCAKSEHHSRLEQRIEDMERDLGNSVSVHKTSMEGRLDGVERKLKEFGIGLEGKGHKGDIEKLEKIVLTGIDQRLTVIEEKHARDFIKRLNDCEMKHIQDFDEMKSRVGDIDKALRDCANMEHYLGLDRKHGALSRQQAEIAELIKGKMQDINGKVDTQQIDLESVKLFVEQRLGELEGRVGDAFRGSELIKEIEQRYSYMQEEQKRARGVLESSLQEQIRLDHASIHSQASQMKEQWDREMKARQAYQENYRDLLGQERSARESQEVQIESRLDSFERSIYSELQRVWREIGRESSPVVVHEVAKEVTPVVVRPPPQGYRIREYVTVPPVVQSQVSSVSTTPIAGIGLTGSHYTPPRASSPSTYASPVATSSPPAPIRMPVVQGSLKVVRNSSQSSLRLANTVA